jgi:hypothetical protein
MTTQNKYDLSELPSLWDMNQQSFGNAETAFRTWFEFSGRAQEHAAKFLSNRWTKDAVALAQLGQCRTPVEATNTQITYLTAAYADYMNEGQKIAGLFSDVARETVPGMFAERTSGKSKHSPRRAPAH